MKRNLSLISLHIQLILCLPDARPAWMGRSGVWSTGKITPVDLVIINPMCKKNGEWKITGYRILMDMPIAAPGQ